MADSVRGAHLEVAQAAREMRSAPTEAEARLWHHLRGRRLAGLRFRRQHAVGRFIFDFYCSAHRLVVKVDGGIHREQQERDQKRDAQLHAAGYRLLRFTNEDVLSRMDDVLAAITHATHSDEGA